MKEHKSFIFGVIATIVWLIGFCCVDGVSWGDFEKLPLNAKGDFIAGLSAPIAFFWLILGYFQQGKELRLQAKEIRDSVEAQRAQAKAIEANTRHTARDVFLQFVPGLFDELIAYSFRIAEHRVMGFWERSRYAQIFNKDIVFSSLTSELLERISEYKVLLQENIKARENIHGYCRAFEKILSESSSADPSGNLLKYYQESTAGRLYKLIKDNFSEHF